MAWRGGRCLAALYLETAAGLRQRSVRKEEALAASAFEKMKSVGDTQQFDPALERAKLEACAKTVAQLGAARACLLYTSPSPRDQRGSRMPSSA